MPIDQAITQARADVFARLASPGIKRYPVKATAVAAFLSRGGVPVTIEGIVRFVSVLSDEGGTPVQNIQVRLHVRTENVTASLLDRSGSIEYRGKFYDLMAPEESDGEVAFYLIEQPT